MLSDRRQRVLSALIEEYVARALPVGSRTLIEHYPLGVSSATVRNELSGLEEEGYVMQPHTSAGRIPTDAGYRAFVNDLMDRELIPQDAAYAATVEGLMASSNELDELLERVSFEMARFTQCLSVVLAPAFHDYRFKQISLVSLTEMRFLLILVTDDGQVLNRQVDYLQGAPAEDLARIQVFLNEILVGHTLAELEQGLCESLRAALRDPLLSCVVSEIVSCMREGSGSRTHTLGVSALLSKPEFAQSESVIPVMQLLEDDAMLLEFVGAASGNDDVLVSIGSENESDALRGVSVVANRFGSGDATGLVAVIGPTRMDYSRVINAVRLASDVLDEL